MMTAPPTSTLTAKAAAARIFAVAAELGTSRQEAILVTKAVAAVRAVRAVRAGRSTDVPLNDTPQHRRRRLAHVVGTLLYDPALNPADVVAAVAGLPASA